jgi:hypothetical protein
MGTIDPYTGSFSPAGVAGKARITARAGNAEGSTTVTIRVHSMQNGAPAQGATGTGFGGIGGVGGEGLGGKVDDATKQKLLTAAAVEPGSADLAWLYPYDKTVWPRGILAPLLQWSTTHAATAVYIHLKEDAYEFQGFYAGTNLVHQPIDQAAWRQATSGNSGDALHVELTITDGAQVWGPIAEDWIIAPGLLKGTVYYGSYKTMLALAIDGTSDAAGILSIKAGATDPTLAIRPLKNKCVMCHTVSADGSTLFAQEGLEKPSLNYDKGYAYDLRNGGAVIQSYSGTTSDGKSKGRRFAWGGIWLDGTFGLAAQNDLYGLAGWTLYNNNATLSPPTGLYRRDTGESMPATGLDGIAWMVTPSFSPDGKRVAFDNWQATDPGVAGGKTIDVLDFACTPLASSAAGVPTCDNAAFSNLRTVYKATDGWAGWPAWLPDASGIVFHHTKVGQGNGGFLQTWRLSTATLWFTTVPSDTSPPVAVDLANLNGTGEDHDFNYEPTVNPIASGGYYWVVYTSRRVYGNVATGDPYDNGDGYAPVRKKLWVSAIDLHPKPGVDPSHPAFYMPGQELNAGNMRGFWAVEPCRDDGALCASGDECCGGACRADATGALVCGAKPPGCANEFERCTASADCCGYLPGGDGFTCAGGFCAAAYAPPR